MMKHLSFDMVHGAKKAYSAIALAALLFAGVSGFVAPIAFAQTGPVPVLSEVAIVPNSGVVNEGRVTDVYFREASGMMDLSIDGTCAVNGVQVTNLTHLSQGLYKANYTVGSGDADRTSGTVPINCTLKTSGNQTVTVNSWTDSNTLAIDVNADGTYGGGGGGGGSTATSTTDGTIDGDVVGGSTNNGSLSVTSIEQLQGEATADGTYENGWKWKFNVTVPSDEDELEMKFGNWTKAGGSATINTANNMRISSPQSSSMPIEITSADSYSNTLPLSGDLDSSTPGRQITITVEMKVPNGTANGSYSTNYGIRTH